MKIELSPLGSLTTFFFTMTWSRTGLHVGGPSRHVKYTSDTRTVGSHSEVNWRLKVVSHRTHQVTPSGTRHKVSLVYVSREPVRTSGNTGARLAIPDSTVIVFTALKILTQARHYLRGRCTRVSSPSSARLCLIPASSRDISAAGISRGSSGRV